MPDRTKKRKSAFFGVSKLVLLFAFAVFATMNAGCPHSHIDTYSPILPGSISGTVRTFDGKSVANAIVFVSKDEYLRDRVAWKKLDKGGGFSFTDLDCGYYYIAAYLDTRNDDTYTIGEDYLGGKLVDMWDLDNTYHPEVREATDTVIDVPLLAPMKMYAVENGTNAVDLNPAFTWDRLSAANYYRLRVTSRKQSYWVIETPNNTMTYGLDAKTGEVVITPPVQLVENLEYLWTVIAFREKNVPVGYGSISRFYTILK